MSLEVIQEMELQKLPFVWGVHRNQRTLEASIVQETMLPLKNSSPRDPHFSQKEGGN